MGGTEGVVEVAAGEPRAVRVAHARLASLAPVVCPDGVFLILINAGGGCRRRGGALPLRASGWLSPSSQLPEYVVSVRAPARFCWLLGSCLLLLC